MGRYGEKQGSSSEQFERLAKAGWQRQEKAGVGLFHFKKSVPLRFLFPAAPFSQRLLCWRRWAGFFDRSGGDIPERPRCRCLFTT
ncbi:MAG: hypothetical protein HY717_13145 [Planctomycetes bacterium]|nr:hypothetical protein [Planctomycetota bacterium]